MLKSHKNTGNRRFVAGGALASVLCVVLAAGLGCSSDPGSGNAAGAGGAVSSAAGAAARGGAATAGGSSGGAAQANGGAGSAAGGAGSGGSAPAAQAGAPATAGGGNGGTRADAGGAPAVSAGAGGGGSGGCTRELLKATVDSYFKALTAHDPSTLPLADSVKFTENGKASKPADAPLWKTAGALKYSHSALDTETCNSATEAVVPDGATDIPLALRIKLVNQKITEIETIAVRSGDYSVASDPAALAASKDTIMWEQTVPADKRNTREELTGWMTKYYKQFPQGVCNTTSSCKRIENGGGDFTCSAGASCAASGGTSSSALNPRLVFADVETGLGVGFTLFTGGYADMHMFKMYGGQVYAVSAILAKATSTGWD